MKKFNKILEEIQILDEKLITFAGKAYPKFGNVVIMAGGAGSGRDSSRAILLGLKVLISTSML